MKNSPFTGKHVLVTGGLGFIGSNLSIRLIQEGANVTIVDSMIPEYGGNLFNIYPVRKKVVINYCDITDKNAMEYVIRGKDYIFHLAGQVSHVMSLSNPFPDIDYNIVGTVVLLEACRKFNPDVKLIFTGTRGQYGESVTLPVSEDAPLNPKGVYELTNLTAEKLFIIYHQNYGIKSVLTRLTNIYGPRAQMKSNKYGVVNWFIRLAIEGKPIQLFGDGSIKRDLVYVDDCVEALVLLALNDGAYGSIFNIGDPHAYTFREIVDAIIAANGSGTFKFAPFSHERKIQEPGDFCSDITKINNTTGWTPHTKLANGLRKTIAYYRKYRDHYW